MSTKARLDLKDRTHFLHVEHYKDGTPIWVCFCGKDFACAENAKAHVDEVGIYG